MSIKTRPCEICGQPIDPQRIEILPETRLCVEHARSIGKFGGEFLVTATQASLGKGGSLKKNYGDVSIQKKRNTEALRKLREEYEQPREDETGSTE
jgi:ribosome-binding protein aMBF1 (putative translation factor)